MYICGVALIAIESRVGSPSRIEDVLRASSALGTSEKVTDTTPVVLEIHLEWGEYVFC